MYSTLNEPTPVYHRLLYLGPVQSICFTNAISPSVFAPLSSAFTLNNRGPLSTINPFPPLLFALSNRKRFSASYFLRDCPFEKHTVPLSRKCPQLECTPLFLKPSELCRFKAPHYISRFQNYYLSIHFSSIPFPFFYSFLHQSIQRMWSILLQWFK